MDHNHTAAVAVYVLKLSQAQRQTKPKLKKIALHWVLTNSGVILFSANTAVRVGKKTEKAEQSLCHFTPLADPPCFNTSFLFSHLKPLTQLYFHFLCSSQCLTLSKTI